MFTIIGGDGKEYGPATLAQIQAWMRAGRVNPDTQVRREGEQNWHRLGDLPEFATPTSSPVLSSVPLAAEHRPVDPKTYADEVIARARPLDIGACLERGWSLYKEHFWPLVGVTLLVIGIQTVLGMIPLIGPVARILLNGVFAGGLYYYYLGRLRNEPRTVNDVFAGFTRSFGSLVLAGVFIFLITVAIVGLLAGPVVAGLLKTAIAVQHHAAPPGFHLGGYAALGLGVAVIIMIFLTVSWLFTFALIIDKGFGAWAAMEASRRIITRQWFRVLAVVLLGGILALLGLFGLLVGFFFTLPLFFGAVLSAYEALCPPAAGPAQPVTTPAPTDATG